MKLIEVANVDKHINSKRILNNVNLSIEKGHAYRLYGDNGCGKTTLLKCILGIAKVDKGDITIRSDTDGSPIKCGDIFRHISVYFSDTSLPKNLKVCECIRLFKKVNEYEGDCEEITERFKINELADKRYGALSTGEKNRVLITTSLLSNCKILILDEPLSGLDYDMKQALGSFLKEIKAKNRTIVVVTHEDDAEFVGKDFYDYVIDGNKGYSVSKN